LSYRNLEALAAKTKPVKMGSVFLKEGTTPEQVEALKNSLGSEKEITKVVYRDRESISKDMQSFLKPTAVNGGLNVDVFPEVFELEFQSSSTPTSLSILKTKLETYDSVAEADFSEGWLQQYRKLSRVLGWIGLVLSSGILIGCALIIANFMGIRHQSRRDEIQLVKLMGAQHGFILSPFLWEGVLDGVLGGAVAFSLLWITTEGTSHYLHQNWNTFLGLNELVFLTPIQSIALLGVGVLMALIGSITVFFRLQENAFR
jgi:cell division transport system permease protein